MNKANAIVKNDSSMDQRETSEDPKANLVDSSHSQHFGRTPTTCSATPIHKEKEIKLSRLEGGSRPARKL